MSVSEGQTLFLSSFLSRLRVVVNSSEAERVGLEGPAAHRHLSLRMARRHCVPVRRSNETPRSYRQYIRSRYLEQVQNLPKPQLCCCAPSAHGSPRRRSPLQSPICIASQRISKIDPPCRSACQEAPPSPSRPIGNRSLCRARRAGRDVTMTSSSVSTIRASVDKHLIVAHRPCMPYYPRISADYCRVICLSSFPPAAVLLSSNFPGPTYGYLHVRRCRLSQRVQVPQ